MTTPYGSFAAEGGPWAPFVAPGWDIGRLRLDPPARPLIMGVVNLTPDSFWSGSRAENADRAVERALQLAAEGTDVLDLGAESSRPGAESIGAAEEMDRLLPALTALRPETDLPLSVDTVRSVTAKAAVAAGADAVNDISAGTWDPLMLDAMAEADCGAVLMHMQGTPRDMQAAPSYGDAAAEVAGWLAARCRLAEEAGVGSARIMVDPGIGFGKRLPHNLALLRDLPRVAGSRPLLLGASRKSFIGRIHPAADEAGVRLPGSLAALVAAWHGKATMVRVHDVAASLQFLEVLRALAGA